MKYNPVLSLLKIAACSGVVALHFGRGFEGASLSVPVFMAVALYLSAAKLTVGGGGACSKNMAHLQAVSRLGNPVFHCPFDHGKEV